ncbi:MAG: hypothetical protein ACRCU2_25990, partial [Planktothrix sp.]
MAEYYNQQLILDAGRILEYSEKPDHVDVMIRKKYNQELLNYSNNFIAILLELYPKFRLKRKH